MSEKQTDMGFKSYYLTKTPEERIAYVKANPDKYKSLEEYRKTQSPVERKLDILIEMMQRFKEYQIK
tara:strand:- start:248 stop:448 length:201 start_codon:yes stop_codon:yes gene_type:complete